MMARHRELGARRIAQGAETEGPPDSSPPSSSPPSSSGKICQYNPRGGLSTNPLGVAAADQLLVADETAPHSLTIGPVDETAPHSFTVDSADDPTSRSITPSPPAGEVFSKPIPTPDALPTPLPSEHGSGDGTSPVSGQYALWRN